MHADWCPPLTHCLGEILYTPVYSSCLIPLQGADVSSHTSCINTCVCSIHLQSYLHRFAKANKLCHGAASRPATTFDRSFRWDLELVDKHWRQLLDPVIHTWPTSLHHTCNTPVMVVYVVAAETSQRRSQYQVNCWSASRQSHQNPHIFYHYAGHNPTTCTVTSRKQWRGFRLSVLDEGPLNGFVATVPSCHKTTVQHNTIQYKIRVCLVGEETKVKKVTLQWLSWQNQS